MDENLDNNLSENLENKSTQEYQITAVTGLYENWFLDYASYVILERAVPALEDGLKPVQRRILHAMREMDDGRFNKVANVIGQTMQYHPHGDAAIGDAMVALGQKELMIETQGNWGDIRTGDSAAAPRYIEARLSKFAMEVAFNKQTTLWQNSYDGRKKEPITLPMKFPLLLAQGVEGIAVGLATKVLPHNFCELLQASIDYLKGRKVELYPDFITGGLVDVGNYNNGKKGGKVRVRARIEESDKKTLLIKDVPYGVTTNQLIDSIIKANDSGKIKIKKVIDNTAKDVEVEVQLAPGVSPDKTIDALYAFTDCEVSISPNACVIANDRPVFLGVDELLQLSTERTKDLLRQELEIKKKELEEAWHYSSIEKIFIEKRIYRDIEECETFEDVIDTIWKGMNKFRKLFRRDLTEDDILRLTEIRIKRISKYDAFKADDILKGIEANLEQVIYDLENLKAFAIKYFEGLMKKYGKGRERKTEIRQFDTIDSKTVAIANQKLYANKAEGFVGYGLKKDDFITDCSDIDDIIVFRRDGVMLVSKVQDKAFMGKDIIHLDVFRKNDERRIYNMIYIDGKTKVSYAKRFPVTGITRDKEYDLTQGSPNSKVLYFTANPAGEAETVAVSLSPLSHARKLHFDFDFATLAIKSRSVQGNILSKYLVKTIKLKTKGVSTLGGINLWYDDAIGRLNIQEHGDFLGNFSGEDLILAIYKDGTYELTSHELSNHFDFEQLIHISKYHSDQPISAIYWDAKSKQFNLKRFLIETNSVNKKFVFIPEEKDNYVLFATDQLEPVVEIISGKGKSSTTKEFALHEMIEVKGWKTIGMKIAGPELERIQLIVEEVIEDEEEDVLTKELIELEQEKIKKLLEDESAEDINSTAKKSNRNDPGQQPKLF